MVTERPVRTLHSYSFDVHLDEGWRDALEDLVSDPDLNLVAGSVDGEGFLGLHELRVLGPQRKRIHRDVLDAVAGDLTAQHFESFGIWFKADDAAGVADQDAMLATRNFRDWHRHRLRYRPA